MKSEKAREERKEELQLKEKLNECPYKCRVRDDSLPDSSHDRTSSAGRGFDREFRMPLFRGPDFFFFSL